MLVPITLCLLYRYHARPLQPGRRTDHPRVRLLGCHGGAGLLCGPADQSQEQAEEEEAPGEAAPIPAAASAAAPHRQDSQRVNWLLRDSTQMPGKAATRGRHNAYEEVTGVHLEMDDRYHRSATRMEATFIPLTKLESWLESWFFSFCIYFYY